MGAGCLATSYNKRPFCCSETTFQYLIFLVQNKKYIGERNVKLSSCESLPGTLENKYIMKQIFFL